MNLQLRLQNFEGPLDLLLHLIERDELDIYDIPIAQITDQYLEYLADIDSVDLDRAAEFLVMAATLCEIKAKMLLPREERAPAADGETTVEPADPRAELVARLLEYSRFKQASQALAQLAAQRGLQFPGPGALIETPPGKPLGDVDLDRLLAAFTALLKRRGPLPEREIVPESVSVQARIAELEQRLAESPSGRLRFSALFPPGAPRLLIVVTFLALLELIRARKVRVWQAEVLGEIELEARQGGDA